MKNFVLSLVSLLIALAGFEFLFFPWFLQGVPVRLATHLPEQLQPLTGRSALSGRLPGPDSIALLGDSNAFGSGDHAYEVARSGGSLPYHSAHEIQKVTGRDVISFGQPGGNPAISLYHFLHRLDYFKEAGLYAISRPKQVVLYFYEGNDMDDLLVSFVATLKGLQRAGVEFQRNSFDILNQFMRRNNPREPSWIETHLPGMFFIASLLRASSPQLKPDADAEPPLRKQKVLVHGDERLIPKRLPLPPWRFEDGDYQELLPWIYISLLNLLKHQPELDVRVVYLPAPFSVYSWETEEIDVDASRVTFNKPWIDATKSLNVEKMFNVSNKLCRLIETISANAKVGFADLRPGLRAEGAKAFLHGPEDWSHFNLHGYKVLGQRVGEYLNGEPRHVGCEDQTPLFVIDSRR